MYSVQKLLPCSSDCLPMFLTKRKPNQFCAAWRKNYRLSFFCNTIALTFHINRHYRVLYILKVELLPILNKFCQVSSYNTNLYNTCIFSGSICYDFYLMCCYLVNLYSIHIHHHEENSCTKDRLDDVANIYEYSSNKL